MSRASAGGSVLNAMHEATKLARTAVAGAVSHMNSQNRYCETCKTTKPLKCFGRAKSGKAGKYYRRRTCNDCREYRVERRKAEKLPADSLIFQLKLHQLWRPTELFE